MYCARVVLSVIDLLYLGSMSSARSLHPNALPSYEAIKTMELLQPLIKPQGVINGSLLAPARAYCSLMIAAGANDHKVVWRWETTMQKDPAKGARGFGIPVGDNQEAKVSTGAVCIPAEANLDGNGGQVCCLTYYRARGSDAPCYRILARCATCLLMLQYTSC